MGMLDVIHRGSAADHAGMQHIWTAGKAQITISPSCRECGGGTPNRVGEGPWPPLSLPMQLGHEDAKSFLFDHTLEESGRQLYFKIHRT